MQEEYFIGLDVGTNSVGWAVTDTQYNLLKCNGKSLWGARLFDPAQSAADRRSFRTARRRQKRSQQRLQWLEEVFSPEISKIDPAFFQRLKLSKYDSNDKARLNGGRPVGKHIIFSGPDYTDRDFYKTYPTIYHLRYALMTEERAFDARLVFLALHHIFKHRGHFLFDGLNISQNSAGQVESASSETDDFSRNFTGPGALKESLARLNAWLENYAFSASQSQNADDCKSVAHRLFDIEACNTAAVLSDILTDKALRINQKHEALLKKLDIPKNAKQLNSILKLAAGGTVKLKDLYGEEIEDEKTSVCLKDDWEQLEPKLKETPEEKIQLIICVKQIYDWALLAGILGGETSISAAKIRLYEKHRSDLKQLKRIIRQTGGCELYNEVFRKNNDTLNNYPAYSGHGASKHQCSYDEFKSYLKKALSQLSQTEEISLINAQLDNGEFLPKQVTKDNGVIPHQLHEMELRRILEKAAAYLPFLNETHSSGLTRSQEIIRMFLFRIPYYVGPLNENSPYSWITRTSQGRIYPWNFEEKVNLEKCAESFITRMTAKCSYTRQDVLPKNSLLYSRFAALNQLNNLRINGQKPPVEIKQKIFNEHLVLSKGRNIKSYLLSEGLIEQDWILSGIDGDIRSELASTRAFKWLLERPGGKAAAENLIKRITLFKEDKKLLEGYIARTYSGLLNKDERQKVMNMKFDGWGRLSKEFLTQIYHIDKTTGECMNILDALWKTNDNLMELLSRRYTFSSALEEYIKANSDKISYTLQDYLVQSYAPPAIRRAVRQAIAIAGEIGQILKRPPKRIFIETTRGEGDKSPTSSRKERLLDLYKKCGEEANPLFQSLSGRTDAELRRDKLYLYYTQLGKCMYSGESIEITELETNYDIDHIYPQSVTKDDSLDNRVLVKRTLNAKKGDSYPLSDEVRGKMREYWAMLNDKKLISDKKYARLTRRTPLTDEELAGFISRQLVETSQSAKLIAELLQQRFSSGATQIVYVKAGCVSSFRQDMRIDSQERQRQSGQCAKNEHTRQDPVFIKCREVNHLHHAKDAYLNIIAGNVYHTKFTANPYNFISQARKERQANSQNIKGSYGYSLNTVFDFDVARNGEMAWKAGENGSIATVRRTMLKNNVLFTRLPYEQKGGFFDQTFMPKGKGQFPIKREMVNNGDIDAAVKKYGGYNNLSGAYFFLAEHQNNKKRVRSIESVYLVYRGLYESDPVKYCETVLGLKQPQIIIPKIRIDSLLKMDGSRIHISGRTNDSIRYKNANQLILSPQWNAYIKGIVKYLERCRIARKNLEITSFDRITAQENLTLYQLFLDKLRVPQYAALYPTPLKELEARREKFAALEIKAQCEVLVQILNLFACTSDKMNLKLLGGKENMGIVQRTKNLKADSDMRLIHQSVTGVFEKEIDLLTVQPI